MAFEWTKVGSNTAKKWLYVLNGNSGRKVLAYAPIENRDIKVRFRRDSLYGGVFTEAIVDSLTFVKDGLKYLKEIYERYGVFAWCDLHIFYLDFTTRTYKELPTSFKVDFNTYQYVKYKRARNAVKVNLTPVNIYSKLMQRQDTEVDLIRTVTLDGNTIDTTRDHWSALDYINIPEINAYRTATYFNTTDQTYLTTSGNTRYAYLIQTLVGQDSDFTEGQDVAYAITNGVYDYTKSIYQESTASRTLTLKGTIYLTLQVWDGDAGSTLDVRWAVLNTSNVVQSSGSIKNVWIGLGAYEIPVDESISVNIGDSIIIYVEMYGNVTAIQFQQTESSLVLQEAVVQSAAATVNAMNIYTAIERNLQLIMDKQFPLYSEFFGHTDIVYNTDGDMYGSESSLRFASLTNGLSLRGAPWTGKISNNVPVKFKDLFKTIKALWNVGATIEKIDGDYRLRIEELAHFYANSEALDLSDRLYDIEIDQQVAIDRAYAKIKTGYNKYEYELVNGRGEYNTVNNRTTEVPSDTEFDNISPYRADTRGITLLLEKPLSETNTEDVKGDEDIFIIKTQRGVVAWDAEVDGDYITIQNNTGIYNEGSLNLYFTPMRNLLRHNYVLKAPFHVYNTVDGADNPLRTTSYLRFQSGSKLTTLQTTDGVESIIENADYAVSDLGNPRWYAEYLIIEISFFEADYEAIKANPKGYITLGTTYSGWIEELTWDMNRNMANIKLLRRWA